MGTDLRSQRILLELSQSALTRQSGVPRQKICIYELGSGSLTADEQRLIREAERLRNISIQIESGQLHPSPAQGASGD
jgi:hypothetical protein